MMQLNSIHIPLTYQQFYNKENPNLDALKVSLSNLDKRTLLECTLTLLKNADSWSSINEFIKHFFSKENEKFAYNVLNRYSEITSDLYKTSNGVMPQVRVLTKHSCLELLHIIFAVKFTGKNIRDNAEFQLVIFDSLLVINGITTPNPNIPKDLDERLRWAYIALLNMSSYNDFTNTDVISNFILQCQKSRLLFEFLNNQENLRRIRDMYLKKIGCKC